MNFEHFVARVKAMRDAQRAYIRTCVNVSGVMLLEQEVDDLIAEATARPAPTKPPTLFDTHSSREPTSRVQAFIRDRGER